MSGEIAILNVAGGDTKLSFNNQDPMETLRTRRIVNDMIKRGYMLMVLVSGEYVRAHGFDEKHDEYLIADFDPTAGTDDGDDDGTEESEGKAAPTRKASRAKVRTKKARKTGRVSAKSNRAIAVPPVSGG